MSIQRSSQKTKTINSSLISHNLPSRWPASTTVKEMAGLSMILNRECSVWAPLRLFYLKLRKAQSAVVSPSRIGRTRAGKWWIRAHLCLTWRESTGKAGIILYTTDRMGSNSVVMCCRSVVREWMTRWEGAVMSEKSTDMRLKGIRKGSHLSLERRKYSRAKTLKYIRWLGIYNEEVINKEDFNYKYIK